MWGVVDDCWLRAEWVFCWGKRMAMQLNQGGALRGMSVFSVFSSSGHTEFQYGNSRGVKGRSKLTV